MQAVSDPRLFEIEPLQGSLQGKRFQLAAKRLFDVVAAALGLMLLTPLLAFAALCIVLESPGPVFFRQKRAGYHDKDFTMLKLRSMRVNDGSAIALVQQAAAVEGTLIKLHNDPRVTGVGKILRSTSLDELPQLLNVLKGEMSLVGPRPLVHFMLTPYPEFRRVRALVRPGITGLWQIRDRSNNTSATAMMPHDLEYLESLSLGLDLKILLKTVQVVASRKGAW